MTRTRTRATHTFAILALSEEAFNEIRGKMETAGYADQFHKISGHGLVIDMAGIAVAADPGRCDRCEATLVVCAHCGVKWCLDHQHNPLVCPGCGRRPSDGS